MEQSNNPQAFPGKEMIDDLDSKLNVGMTLRDYFAAKALNIMPFIAKDIYRNETTWTEDHFAAEAYKIADAMLEEREK